ncbi:hypothetical protein KEM55_005709 [Ascosphaera atra]|nr:hypothetical protein KEM55_005709 [Ascosphaera atra]
MLLSCGALAAALLSHLLPVSALGSTLAYNESIAALLPRDLSLALYDDDRPPECPPCFNCQLDKFQCQHFSRCNKFTGNCLCPPGFGGNDCADPVCGALSDGENRPLRKGKYCNCKDGWDGINCNVCKSDDACNALMPQNEGGVCYTDGLLVNENHHMCDVTNRKIQDQLKEKKAQVTFSCANSTGECSFQFWIDHLESFYCALDTCSFDYKDYDYYNTTKYSCANVDCKCVPGRTLCGESGGVDIGDFLTTVTGPASFSTRKTRGGSPLDGSTFSEPAMNSLISTIFGDRSISLNCHSGECLYKSQVPGSQPPMKAINTPLIAGVIAFAGLFVVAVAMTLWFSARRSSMNRYGEIALLDDSDDDSASLITNHKPTALHFENVSYYLNGRQILSGIQGSVHPGQVMAIIGASGAGKSTFLDILARKNKRGHSQGNFYVNGKQISDAEYKRSIGFVDQEDTMLPTLTVHETILTSALLRLPRDMSRLAKEQRVAEVERQLGIYHIRDQLIGADEGVGGPGRGISGGEKRRVGIACELVTSPALLFLDEPTSGLDAFNAYNVIECLVTLAKDYNRTIIFTIHQPRSNIVALFDQLVLLSKGKTVYSGPFATCQSYFDDIGYSCPPGFNIADYLVDLTMHASEPRFDDYSDLVHRAAPRGDAAVGRNHTPQVKTPSSSVIAVKSIPGSSINTEDPESGTATGTGTGNVTPSTGQASTSDSANTRAHELLAPTYTERIQSTAPAHRPKGRRRESLRQQQERELFTRKRKPSHAKAPLIRTNTGGSVNEDEPLPPVAIPTENSQQWLRLHRTNPPHAQGQGQPTIAEDADNLLPTAPGALSDLDALVANYHGSRVAAALHEEINAAVAAAEDADSPASDDRQSTTSQSAHRGSTYSTGNPPPSRRISMFRQFIILSQRTWRNLYRNPMLMLIHYAIAIVLAVLSGYLFYGLTDDIKGFQNRLGLFFFLLALFGFSTLTSLNVFSAERLLFVRERANGYYAPVTYFAAKVVFDIVPLRLIPPILMGVIVYPMVGLIPDWPEFLRFMLILVLFNMASAAICLFIGILFRDNGVANLIGSLVMLFSLLFAGLLLNHDAIPKSALWLQSLSIFHYGFEALIVNEVTYLTLTDHKYGLNIEVPGASILSAFGFDTQALWKDVIGLGVFAASFVVIAYLAMHFLLVEKR